MANEHWYGLKIRRGFEQLVTQRLQKLNLEVFVPEHYTVTPEETEEQENSPAISIYSRFDLRMRNSVVAIPGVLDIAGTPEPTPCDEEVSTMRRKAFRVL